MRDPLTMFLDNFDNIKYKKIVKKVLTKLFEGGIVILVLKKRAKQKNEL